MEYIVRTHHLTKRVKGKELVSDINLHIKKGEIYGFLGQNGAGKTTILRLLTTLIKPTAGEIEMFGKKLTENTKDLLKRVGSIIEYPIFYEHLTAKENMQLHCEYLGFYDEAAIDHALDLVHLKNIEGKPVKSFSLGMKQRLGIARAIITKPELIILDEPTNGLDPIGIKEIRDLFKMLNKQYGITLVISSHILGEIEQIADRIGVIKEGKLINDVSIADIHKQKTDYIELVTRHINQAVYVLEQELQITNFKIVDENRIRIYDFRLSPSEISKELILRGVDIEEIHKHSSSLEDYFYQQINGGGVIV
ncbi:MAG TPA: ATP-binding cassette domain-containing protein [Bacillus sp. (in: firmicutes)]|uniref:ATP-binding cassette domain-containing protein n=1 Tax=Bacillus litorisediminis TaxID=2922713 RepID=UPI001FAE53CB|nr:ATP-binding cassette domain-containing protein [Bacillus litorisediminis]HWO78683.1 ATP-binding cassette domain-containing protein [Bacillus sp. (in: firmicutes)]